MSRSAIVMACILVGVVAIGGGAWYFYSRVAHTPIGELIQNPRAYEDKTLTIEGTVTERASLFIIKYYALKDDTGAINVVTSRMLPNVGSKVRVRGKVEEAFALGDAQILVFVEEKGN